MESSKDLKPIAEDVLPAFEKFLQSPEEKRLRRVRAGVITSGIGLAVSIAVFLAAMVEDDFLPMLAPAFTTLIIGLSMVINGLWFTLPRKKPSGELRDSVPAKLSGFTNYEPPQLNANTNDLALRVPVSSVTDHTTHHLKSNKS